MTRRRRIAAMVVAAAGVLVLLLFIVVLVHTNTDWGRERVRRFAVDRLNRTADGQIAIGRLEGNLLEGVRIVDFSIVDAERRPFVRVDTLDTRFSLRSLLRQRIVLTDIRAVDPVIVLDKPPGEEWNWVRIFPPGDEPIAPRRPGFGDWLELRDLALIDGHVTVRTEWAPAEDLTPEEREETVRQILAGEGRENIIEVPGGYQNVMYFRQLNAEFPLIVAAHPDSAALPMEVAHFSAIAQPYRPPPAVVRDLSGSFRLATDTLYFTNVRAVMPGSRIAGEGTYALDAGDLFLRLNGAPLAFADMRWLYPPLPEEGGGSLRLEVQRQTIATRLIATEMDLRTGDATFEGSADVTLGDTLLLRESDLRFAHVHTRLLERLLPDFSAPRPGELAGELALVGSPEAMKLDGDIAFADDAGGDSRVLAEGEVSVVGDVAFRDLRLEFRPLQAELLRVAAPQLPIRGTIEGDARLTGTLAGRLDLDSDLTLRDPRSGLSRVRATGGVDFADETRLHRMLVRFDPLRLDLVREEIPELPAGGTLAGEIRLDGIPTRALSVDGSLALTDPATGVSRVAGVGGIAFGDELIFQNLALTFDPLQMNLVRGWAPELPAGATILGEARLDGAPTRRLSVDADVTVRDPATGDSRIVAVGGIRNADGVRFDDMALRFDPLQLDLVRSWAPELPEGATATGPLHLDGSPEGELTLDGDLAIDDPRSGMSQVRAAGSVDLAGELAVRELRVEADPLRLDLVRRWEPRLPVGATVYGQALLDGVPGRELRVDGDAEIHDPATGVSRVAATGGIRTADEMRFQGLQLRFEPLRMNLARGYFPELPAGGTLEGRLRLDGVPSGLLQVDGDLTAFDPVNGRSHLVAVGGLDLGEQRFDDLRLHMDPLQMSLVQAVAPQVPLAGTLSGSATLNGSPDSRLAVEGDVQHVEGDERSHVVGNLTLSEGEDGFASADVRLMPLSLDVAGRFAPAAGLRGSVSGTLRAEGNLEAVALDADLDVVDGGAIDLTGTLDLASAEPSYDLRANMSAFDMSALTTRAPATTTLTGFAAATGRGTDPATMNAEITADLVGPRVNDLAAEEVRLRVGIVDGLLRADSSVIRLATAEAMIDGTFGLVREREGALTYRVRADSLHTFAPWVPGADTAVVLPSAEREGAERTTALPQAPVAAERVGLEPDSAAVVGKPAKVQTAVALSGADVPGQGRALGDPGEGRSPAQAGILTEDPRSPDAARSSSADPTRAELGIARSDGNDGSAPDDDGRPVLGGAGRGPQLPFGSAAASAAPADSLAGSLFAEGGARGNIHLFDLWGRATAENFVARGTAIGSGWADYSLAGIGTPAPAIEVDTEVRDVRAAGLAFDSLEADVHYGGGRFGSGSAIIAAYSEENADLVADAEFALAVDRNEVRFADLEVRVDTVRWEMLRPAVITWGDEGVAVDSLELVSDGGGRIAATGELPIAGDADLDIVIQDLEVGHIVALLQTGSDAAGRVDLDARVTGSARNPIMTGNGSLVNGFLDGQALPDARATFSYSDRELVANAELLHGDTLLAVADARLPIDLGLTGVTGSRLLEGPLSVDLRADDLRLDMIPGFTDLVEEVEGTVVGFASLGGTFEDPRLEGQVDLDLETVSVVPIGVRFEEVAGRVTMDGQTVRIDSLIAWSRGPIHISGEIGLPTLSEPVIDLAVQADNALVINTDDARMRLDSDLAITGTLDAIEVSGEINTRSGVVYIPDLADFGGGTIVDLDDPVVLARVDTILRAEREALMQRSPFLRRVQADISVSIDRDVWLRSTEANVEIYTPAEAGPLRIVMDGQDESFALEGTINTDRGEYEFMSRRFDLTRGAAIFQGDPGFNPMLQIAAEHEVRLPGREAFSIRVVLDGYIRELAITLESTSQPPIPQTDLLSYLAVGRDASSLLFQQGSPLSGEGSLSGGLVGNVAGLATQQLAAVSLEAMLSDVERDAMRSTRLDVFRISPADLPAELFTGSYLDVVRGTELEAGKYIGPRLFVAGQARADNPIPGLLLEYTTPGGFSWVMTWMPRYLPSEPSLGEPEVRRSRILGSFLFREWRF
jgi:autotransporter translocation and assembly factor TamB